MENNEKQDWSIITVNLEYLKKLDNPEQVFTRKTWNIMLNNINTRFQYNKDFEFIKSKQLSEISPQFGILWRQKSDIKLKELFVKNIQKDKSKKLKIDELFVENIIDIKNQNKTNTWRARGITILMANLYSITEFDLTIIAHALYNPSQKEIYESQCDHDSIRLTTFKEFNNVKNNITNDTYEFYVENMIKKIGKTLIINGNFYNVNIEKYIKVFYYRFFLFKNYEDICNKVNIHHGSINNMLTKFREEFNKTFNSNDFIILCRKFENMYEKAFIELDDSNLVERNKRLNVLKSFQHYFITDNFADYID